MSQQIKEIYVSGLNILIQDLDGNIWIMGGNKCRSVGYNINDENIYDPIITNIKLLPGEYIKSFVSYLFTVYIATSNGSLYVSNYKFKNTLIKKNSDDDDDDDGSEYDTDEQTESDINDVDDIEENQKINICEPLYIADENLNIISDLTFGDKICEYLHFTIEEFKQIPSSEIFNVGKSIDFYLNKDMNQKPPKIVRILEFLSKKLSLEINRRDTDKLLICPESDSKYINNFVFNKKEEGFSLIINDAIDWIIKGNVILFRKNIDNQVKLFFFDPTVKFDNMYFLKRIGLTTIPHISEAIEYYEILFPFDITNMTKTDDFYYINVNNYHHIISSYAVEEIPELKKYDSIIDESDYDEYFTIGWLYFNTDLKIDPNNIYLIDSGTIFVYHCQSLYKYFLKDHKIHVVSTNVESIFFERDDVNFMYCSYLIRKKDGLYSFEYTIDDKNVYVASIDDTMTIIDAAVHTISHIYVIKTDEDWKYKIINYNLYINASIIKFYKISLSYAILYDSDISQLLMFNVDKIKPKKYNLTEVNILGSDEKAWSVYKFDNIPDNIVNISFTHDIILIKTLDKYYYKTFHDYQRKKYQKFGKGKFIELSFDSKKLLVNINKNNIVYSNKYFESDNYQIVYVNLGSDNLSKMINVMDLFKNISDFAIQYIVNNKTVSSGDGPKREFIDSAIGTFFKKYLIQHNILTEFNLDLMKDFSEDTLESIGFMLHSFICYNLSSLQFMLPLRVFKYISDKEITVDELEYFLKIEDPEMSKQMLKFESDPEGFNMLETDYDNYADMLLHKTYYVNSDNKTLDNVARAIGTGFKNYHNVPNLKYMNYPTLNYYISGINLIDRDALINLMRYPLDDDYKIYYEYFIKQIKIMPEDDLKKLLKNWSGTSILQKSGEYTINIGKIYNNNVGVNFSTCNKSITINQDIVQDSNSDMILNLLISPTSLMID